VFTYGLTSIMTLDDVVDYASATSTTKNGHLGIKVRAPAAAAWGRCAPLLRLAPCSGWGQLEGPLMLGGDAACGCRVSMRKAARGLCS
jgi:hypothetical protein